MRLAYFRGILMVICVCFFIVLSATTQGTAAEWKLKEGDTIHYKIETLLLNGSGHADEIDSDYFTLYDVTEGDVFTLRVGEISSAAEECEWEYGIWAGGRVVHSTSASGDFPCEEGTGFGMIFTVEDRDHYESVVANINS
ncbi:MAG: hypothetical protein ACXAB4_10090, partial [Candidatus Hodarchaeales archaeon]